MKIIYSVSFLLIFVSFTCKESTSPIEWSGIVVTDEFGLVQKEDPDDWQPRCNNEDNAEFCIMYVFPNPTDTLITFAFFVSDTADVEITIQDFPGHTIAHIDSLYYSRGLQHVKWITKYMDGNFLQNGIYRAFISAKTSENLIKSYGDIQIIR